MIKYSFLLCCWNLDVSLIKRMLDSIPQRDDIEILLLDNASNNSSNGQSIYASLEGERTRVILHPSRISLGECRNHLIGLAQGEWIIFADVDDIFFTEELNRVLDSAATTDYDLVYWGTKTFYTDGKIVDDSYGYQGTEIQPLRNRDYLIQHRFEAWRKMVRRDLLMQHSEVRFAPCILCEDVLYSINLLLATSKVGVYPPLVYSYVRDDASILGSKRSMKEVKQALSCMFQALDILHAHGYSLVEQEVSKACLIRMRWISKIQFFRYLLYEWHRYGWALFYRDLVGAGFETYETNILKALFSYMRVKLGALKRSFSK
ncbi:MAG: glycosyltransferase family 2 protein [Bacteroidales bacterium]|nr:glycosyltransferase family 2 protein [Bacteroidales bacterium]